MKKRDFRPLISFILMPFGHLRSGRNLYMDRFGDISLQGPHVTGTDSLAAWHAEVAIVITNFLKRRCPPSRDQHQVNQQELINLSSSHEQGTSVDRSTNINLVSLYFGVRTGVKRCMDWTYCIVPWAPFSLFLRLKRIPASIVKNYVM
uniref:Uncharacterized protein n=1 Tax=Coccidioides posadasii RMSCC 3488 TaxID=454284 RepID=A0A0J6F7I6_COCPO|nr:hypothetical protein CPAG_01611 [Coccidioides posadasii RMSCC 3488]